MTETSPAVEVQSEYGEPREPRTGLLVTLALAWLAVILWYGHAAVAVNDGEVAVISAAIALPTVVAASLLAGGAGGLAAVSLLAARGVINPAPRLAAGSAAGLIAGVLAAVSILATWGVQGSVAALAVAVAAAGLLGAALAVALSRAVAAAGLVATLAVIVTGFAINYLFREWLMSRFGSGDSAAYLSAFGWFAFTASVAAALVGGLLAFWHLRRTVRLTGEPMRWPAYLAAGAGPGAMLLVAEAVTRLGGARLLALAASGSTLDGAMLDWARDSRLNHALVVLFLGAIVAMIAFGRTLPRRDPPVPR